MKKIFLSLITLLLAVTVYGQKMTFDSFFKKYSDKEGYTTVTLSGSMLKMAMPEGLSGLGDSLSKIDEMKIIVEEKSTPEFVESVKSLVSQGYEILMSVEDKETQVSLYKKTKGKLDDMVLLVSEEDENVFIRVTGKELDLSSLTALAGNKFGDKK